MYLHINVTCAYVQTMVETSVILAYIHTYTPCPYMNGALFSFQRRIEGVEFGANSSFLASYDAVCSMDMNTDDAWSVMENRKRRRKCVLWKTSYVKENTYPTNMLGSQYSSNKLLRYSCCALSKAHTVETKRGNISEVLQTKLWSFAILLRCKQE